MLEMKFGTTIRMFFVILTFSTGLGDYQLSENFKYYEIAHQNNFRHTIKRRSVGNEYHSTNLDVTFKNKNYRFELKREDSLFRPDFKVYGVNEHDVATEIQGLGLNLFHGHIAGQSGRSKVSAIFGDDGKLGSFVVRTAEDTFAGEPLISFDKEANNIDKLVIYSLQDMKSSGRHDRKYQSCGNNETHEEEFHNGKAPTAKRSTSACQEENRKACSLYVAVDYSFFESIGGRSLSLTGKIVVYVIDFVNSIFKETTFGECGRNFGFQIKKMYIYQNISNNISHFNRIKNGTLNSKEFLCSFGDEHSSPELPNHCLGHLFTARPMFGDVLGLSNIARKLKWDSESGLCSRKLRSCYNQMKYVNTGFTSFVDSYSKRLPSLQAALVAAHELGHSFGSHHDLDPSCSQDKYPGFYLMYTYSVSGAEPNNKVFSNCSITEIRDVLKSKTASCLEAYNVSFCGNYKIEGKEECDDGFEGSKCCSNQCKLKGDSQCGLNQECCTECKFSESSKVCRSSGPCFGPASCSGNGAICPESVPSNTNSSCQTRSRLPGRCHNDKCLSLCELKGQLTCFCHGENMCKTCCKDKFPENSTCELYNNEAQDLPDGVACAFGVCQHGQCRKTEVGQVQRLWPIIDIQNISSIVIFTKNNIVGLVLIVSLLVWIPASCFVVHLDRKNLEEELETLQWMRSSQTTFIPEKSKIKIRHSAASR